MTQHILYLGSKSPTRRHLLEEAHIPFHPLEHQCDEEAVPACEPFERYVLEIAKGKMAHLLLPAVADVGSSELFVLTADTLLRASKTGDILGKPRDLAHAMEMLQIMRAQPIQVVTGCCLEKYTAIDGAWQPAKREHFTVSALVEFMVSDDEASLYFKRVPLALYCAGGASIEGFGSNFLKRLEGSYAAVQGLPIYELRQALKKMGFFS